MANEVVSQDGGVDSKPINADNTKKNIDVFNTVISGISALGEKYNPSTQAAIIAEQVKHGDVLTIDGKEETWKKHADKFAGNRDAFESLYNNALGIYGAVKSSAFNFPQNPPVQYSPVEKSGLMARLGLQGQAGSFVNEVNPNHYVGYEPFGYNPIATNQELAARSGWYQDKYGKTQDLSLLDPSKEGQNALYVQQDRDASGNLKGDPYLKEKGDRENTYGKEIYSLYGSNSFHGSALFDFGNSLFNTAFVGTGKGISDLWSHVVSRPLKSLADYTETSLGSGPIFYEDPYTKQRFVVDYSNTKNSIKDGPEYQKLLNSTSKDKRITPDEYIDRMDADRESKQGTIDAAYEALKFPITQGQQAEGQFGSLNAAAKSIGSGLGFLAPAGAATSFRYATLGGDVVRGAEAAAMVTKKLSNFSAGFGTAQMLPELYSEARASGLSDHDATLFALACAPGVATAERLTGSPWMSSFFLNGAARQDVKIALRKELADAVKLAGKEGIDPTSMINLSKTSVKNIYNGVVNFAKNHLEDRGALGVGLRAAQGFKAESLEEGAEELFYNGVKDIHDRYFSKEGSTAGKGKFGNDFFSKNAWQSAFDNWLAGGVIGGLVGGFRSTNKSQYQDNLFSKAVVNGDEDYLQSLIIDLHKQGQLGETFLDENGNTMNTAQQADGDTRSMNDVNKESLLQRLNYHKELKSQLGLNDAGVMAKLEGDKTLFHEAIDIAKQQNDLASQIKDIESKKVDASANDKPTEAFDRQLEPLKKQQTDATERLNDILSGKAVEEKIKDNAIAQHFTKENLPQEELDKVPSAKFVDITNKEVLDHDLAIKAAQAERKQQREQFTAALTDDVSKLKQIDISKSSDEFFKQLNKVQSAITSTLEFTPDVAIKDVMSSIETSRKALVDQMAASIPEDKRPDIESPTYEEEITSQTTDKAAAEIFLKLSDDKYSTLAQQKAATENQKTLTENEQEKQNAVDSYTKHFDPKNPNKSGIEISDIVNGIEAKGETITDTDIENLKAIDKLLSLRKNAATVNNKVYPGLKYHATQPAGTKIDDSQLNAIGSNINTLQKRISDLLIKAQEYKISRANKDARVKSEDLKMRLGLITKLQSILGIESKYTDKASEEFIKGNIDASEIALLSAEEVLHNTEGPKLRAAMESVAKSIALTQGLDKGASYDSAREFNYNSFDQLFSASTLDRSDYKSSSAAGDFAIMYITNYFNSIRRLSPSAFYNSYKEALSEMPKDSNVASYEQEMIIRQMISHSIGDDNAFTKVIAKAFRPDSDERMSDYINHSLAIRGFAGTGKTTTMSKIALSIYGKLNGSKANVSIIAPSSSLAEKFGNVVKDDVKSASVSNFSSFTTLSNLGPQTNILIIDEASALSKEKLELIQKKVTDRNEQNKDSKPVLIWMFGDQSQMASLKETSKFSPFESMMERTVPASTVFRSDVADISSIQEAIRTSMFYKDREMKIPDTTFNTVREEGVEYFHGDANETIQDIFEKSRPEYNGESLYETVLKDILNPDTEKRTAVIVYDSKDRDYILNKILNDPRATTYSKQDIEKFVRHLDEGDGSILGHDVDRVYLAISPLDKEKNYQRAVLTGATRAKKFVSMFITDPATKSKVGNVIKTAPDTNEAKAEKKSTLDKRIDAITEALPASKKATKSEPKQKADTSTATPKTKKVTPKDNEKAQKKTKKDKKTKVDKSEPIITPAPEPIIAAPTFNQPGNGNMPVNGTYSAKKFFGSKHAYTSLANSYLPGSYDSASDANEHLKYKMAYLADVYKKIGRGLSPEFKISYKPVAKLNAAGKAMADFNHVIEVRVSNIKDFSDTVFKSTGKRLAEKEIAENNYDLIGVLPNPVVDKTGIAPGAGDENFYKNAANVKSLYSKIDKFYTSAEEKSYNKMLVDIRVSGAKDANLGKFKMASLEQGKLVDAPKEQSLAILKKNIDDKGFYTDGILYQDSNAYYKKDGTSVMAVVIKIAAAKGLPETKVIVNTPVLQQYDLTAIDEDIKKLSNTTGLTTSDINQSLAYKTIIFNQSVSPITLEQTANTAKLLKNVKAYWKAANAAIKKDSTLKLRSLTNTTMVGDNVMLTGVNFSEFTTRIADVNYPSAYMNFSAGSANLTPETPTEKSATLSRIDSRMGKTRKKAKFTSLNEDEVRMSKEKAQDYFNRVFGSEFVNNKLEFKPNLDLDNMSLYGYMKDGNVFLENKENGIESLTPRHEAWHVAFNYLISDQSRALIIQDIKQRIATQKGISIDFITDEQADEYGAGQYEMTEDPTTLFGKFIKWVKSIFSKWKTYQDTMEDLMYQIEYGKFKDEPFIATDQQPIYREKKKTNKDVNYQEEDYENDGTDISKDSTLAQGDGFIGDVRDFTDRSDKYSNFHSLTKVFGDDSTSQLIRRNVADNIKTLSNFNKNIFDVSVNLAEAINRTLIHFTTLSQHYGMEPNEPILSNGKVLKSIADISGEDFKYVEDEQDRKAYIYHKLSNEQIFYQMVKKTFPKLDIAKTVSIGFNEKETDADKVDMSLEDAFYENAESNIHEDNEKRDYMDSTSQFLKWNLETLPRRKYGVTKDGNLFYKFDDNSSFVNTRQLHRDLIETSNAVGPIDYEQRIADAVYDMADATRISNADGSVSYNDASNDMLTFYYEYLSPYAFEHVANIDGSYTMMPKEVSEINMDALDESSKAQTADNMFSHSMLANRMHDINAAFPNAQASIAAKASKSITLTNALLSTFKSISPKNIIEYRFNKSGGVKFVLPMTADVAGIKNEFTKSLDNSLFDSSGIKDHVANAINGKRFIVTSKAITSVQSGKTLITINSKAGSVIGFSMSSKLGFDDIREITKFLGLKLRKDTFTMYLSDKNPNHRLSELAEILGSFMLSTKIAADEKFEGAGLLDKYYEKNQAKSDPFEVANSSDLSARERSAAMDEAKDNSNRERRPSDLFLLKEKLAYAEARSRGDGTNRKYYNVKNKAEYTDTFSNTLYRLLGFSNDDNDASSRLKQNPGYIAQANPNYAPLIDGTPHVFNAFGNANSQARIIKIFSAGGASDGRRGKDHSEIKGVDYAKLVLDGSFIESVMPSIMKDVPEQIMHVFQPTSERSKVPVFKTSLSLKGRGDKLITKKGDKVEIGYRLVKDHFTNIFEHHNAIKNTSMDRWAMALLSSPAGVNQSSVNPEAWKSNPIEFQRYITKLNSELSSSGKLAEHIKHLQKTSGFVENHDIVYENGMPMPGKATMFYSHPIFNSTNLKYWRQFTATNPTLDEVGEYMRKYLIGGQYTQMVDYLKSIGYKMPDSVLNTVDNSQSRYKNYEEDENGKMVLKSFNPFYEAYLYSSIIHGHYLNEIVMGESTYYKSIKDLFARGAGPTAPGKVGSLYIQNAGLRPNLKLAITNMFPGKTYDQVTGSPSVKVFDGYSIMNPVTHALARTSDGDEMGQMGDSMIKPQYFFQGTYIKTGAMPLRGSLIDNSDFYSAMFQKMNGPRINTMYQQLRGAGLSFDETMRRIAIEINSDPSLHDDIKVDIMADPSSVKSGGNHMNDFEDSEYTTQPILQEHFQIQLNPSQDIENTNLATATQINSAVGVGPQNAGRATRINQIQATLSDMYMSSLIQKISKQPGEMKEKLTNFLRDIGKSGSEQIGDVSRFVDEINNDNISIDIPSVRFKLMQFLNNKVTRNAIKPKSNGVRMNQAPGQGLEIFDTENGPMTKADALKAGVVLIGPGRPLKPMTWSEGAVSFAEVIVPFSYVSQFGFTADMNIHEMRAALANDPEKLKAFNQATTILLTRTPAGSTSAGFAAKAIGFFNDIGNTVFIPEQHNILTGGDFDIDQLSDFFAYIDDNGNMPLDGYDGLRNQLILELIGYYNDPANKDIITTPTDLSTLKELANQSGFESRYELSEGDPTTQMVFHNIIMDGKDMTGRFANGNKAYEFLMQAVGINSKKGGVPLTSGWNLNPDGKDANGKYILSSYNNSIDASTTNAKNIILGSLGVSPELGNIINAGIASGESEVDIYQAISLPVVTEVVKRLREKTNMNSVNQNEFGKTYTIFDAINDVKAEVESAKHPAFEEMENLAALSEAGKKVDAVEFEALKTQFLKDQPEFDARKQSDLVRLQALEQKAYLGEALSRVNSIVGINANGLKVTDFDFDKYLRNAAFILNQDVSDFLSGQEPLFEDWFLSMNRYMDGDAKDPNTELGAFVAKEARIRSMINIPAVINNLEHIKKYMANALQVQEWNKQSYLQNSVLFKDVENNFLNKIRKDAFNFEGNAYGFRNEMWRFMDALFFEKYYANTSFESMTGILKSAKVNISTPGGRYSFGQEFPAYLKDLIDRGVSKGDKKVTDNLFIDRLNITHMEHLPVDDKSAFVELTDMQSITPEQFADMRQDFSKLDDIEPGLTEKFWLYNKMKSRPGSTVSKGDLGEAMAVNKYDEAYSDFLRGFRTMADQYETSSDALYTYGNGTTTKVSDMFNSFIGSVAAYNSDLVQANNKNRPWTDDNRPSIYKEYVDEQGLTLIYEKGIDRPYIGSYIDRFNPYDVHQAAVSDIQVLKNLPYAQYAKWRNGGAIEVTYNNVVHFSSATKQNWQNGLIDMPDGSQGVVIHSSVEGKKKTVLKIKPVKVYQNENLKRSVGEDIEYIKDKSKKNLDTYLTITSKEDFAKHVEKNGTSGYMRDLFQALNSLHGSNQARVGKIEFKTSATDYNLMQDKIKDGVETAAYFNPTTRDIVINKSVLNGSGFRIEKLFAHEIVHDYTLSALDENRTPTNVHEIEFRTKIQAMFTSAKSWATDNGYNVDKTYGFKNMAEFDSEAFGNNAFQAMLMRIPSVEGIKTKSNFFEKFVNAVTEFLSGLTGIKIDNSLLSQVINVTGDYISDSSYFEAVYNKEPKLKPNGRVNARNSEEYSDEVDNIVNSLMSNLTKIC